MCQCHMSITNSTEPQDALLRIVVQKQSLSRQPNLLFSTGLLINRTEDSPPSTGLLGRPLSGQIHDLTCKRGSVGQSEGLSIPRSSVRFRLKPDNSNSHEFELYRPSNKVLNYF